MKERIEKELKAVLPQGTTINIHLPDLRGGKVDHSVWRGGSVFASQIEFGCLGISMRDFDEVGPSIIHQRCF